MRTMQRCAAGHWWDPRVKRLSKDECPFCYVAGRRTLGRNPPPLKLTQDERMYNYYASMIPEYERIKAAQVPGAFTGKIPDTPEAAAVRRQIEISKGKDVP